jgi:hypothetical protein
MSQTIFELVECTTLGDEQQMFIDHSQLEMQPHTLGFFTTLQAAENAIKERWENISYKAARFVYYYYINEFVTDVLTFSMTKSRYCTRKSS